MPGQMQQRAFSPTIEDAQPATMYEKELGRTGVWLPANGLGTWEYKGGVEPLRKGIALGAWLIDTAESYGTEEVVGQAVRGIRNCVFIATKVSPIHFKRADLFAAADRSLQKLGTDRIDLYQLHRPNFAIPIEETMAAMEALVDKGKVRYIGVSNFSASDLRNAQAALTKYRIVSNQVRYSLVERTVERNLLRYCQENGITVIAYSPLGHGMQNIWAKDPDLTVAKVAEITGRTEAQVALNWCISKEAVIAITKADSADHVAQNCLASGGRLTPEQSALLAKRVKFRCRGSLEIALRRLLRHLLQRLGQQS